MEIESQNSQIKRDYMRLNSPHKAVITLALLVLRHARREEQVPPAEFGSGVKRILVSITDIISVAQEINAGSY